MASSSSSSSAADSYIGCLISLTSKSEIRYEGVLYNINTDESSIGLRNVRSFGTEGRKKDGPQIPSGDKVYEYILFRGTDIKDIQVKSSPPVHPTPPVNTDPAIIQSQYSRPVTTTASLPAVSGPLTAPGSHATQLGLPGSNFQAPLPLYQPGGSWGASPPAPNANGGGLSMPMYWQGYYGAPNGLPQLQQQSLLRQPPGLSMPSSMQQQMQFPNFNPSLYNRPSNLPDIPSSLLPVSTSSPSVSTPVPPSNLPTTLPSAPPATLAPEALPVSVQNKAPTGSLSAVSLPSNLPSLTPFSNGGPDIGGVGPSVNKPNGISGSSLPYQTVSQLTPATVGSSNSIRKEPPVPSLVTPGQLLQSGPAIVSSSQPLQTPHKDVEVIQVSSTLPPETSVPVTAETQPPILPLPPGGAPSETHHGYGYRGRGRGRGAGGMRQVARFTEDFDFMAMNEKFNKDEVWGHLGKSKHSTDGEEIASDEYYSQNEEGNADVSKLEAKPVYNKDDFFDSLSSNALDRNSQNGRIRYPEQFKIDTETFGEISRHRGGWGGRGPWRGGRARGSYYGYGGRGRGRGGHGHG
ncbi:PREDICTED: protein decapping 5-like isoform X2 [Lupinus angustifolius]|uniref:protein decapping 5-like isoform X2 n=1 Tax=Lupinus angustifolius TaxID=3871 RepID=UPI00092E4C35|nr:PREDICTED: protein decapping 5-like isoform X2 [Lupinus angustifolius]